MNKVEFKGKERWWLVENGRLYLAAKSGEWKLAGDVEAIRAGKPVSLNGWSNSEVLQDVKHVLFPDIVAKEEAKEAALEAARLERIADQVTKDGAIALSREIADVASAMNKLSELVYPHARVRSREAWDAKNQMVLEISANDAEIYDAKDVYLASQALAWLGKGEGAFSNALICAALLLGLDKVRSEIYAI